MESSRSLLVILVMTLGFEVAGCKSSQPCRCSDEKELGVWCGACEVGHVASARIESRELFEAIDAHGHHVRPDSFRCEACRQAIRSDGFCRKCKIGFVDQQAYFSKLTYLLARGRLTETSSIACARCRTYTRQPGWCDTCRVGRVGHIAYRDPDLFAQAVKAYDVLHQAIRIQDQCSSCAIAIAVDRRCYRCKKSYEDGRIIEPPDSLD